MAGAVGRRCYQVVFNGVVHHQSRLGRAVCGFAIWLLSGARGHDAQFLGKLADVPTGTALQCQRGADVVGPGFSIALSACVEQVEQRAVVALVLVS